MKKEVKNAWIIFAGGLITLLGVYFVHHLRYYGYGWISAIWISIGALIFGYGLYGELK